MVKRGPHMRPQTSEGEGQHGPFCWTGCFSQGDEHLLGSRSRVWADVRQVSIPKRLFHLVLESHDGRAPGADSEEKHEPVSDIDTVVVDIPKALDPEWPIIEATFRALRSAASDQNRTAHLRQRALRFS